MSKPPARLYLYARAARYSVTCLSAVLSMATSNLSVTFRKELNRQRRGIKGGLRGDGFGSIRIDFDFGRLIEPEERN
eukprot:CAMPEP_0168354386 /NCGR_PEP_ID=MMETSP0213-20121227/23869_1 /TAXON_ID=151035 /ORGANISM="Euplotes harpa, Strain FSP1.4" /LENGTH=76 /DNA_ID=CAMNT_0008366285 /DNA_START=381 /DNA_END=611 /DNA_ORIENTATION=-